MSHLPQTAISDKSISVWNKDIFSHNFLQCRHCDRDRSFKKKNPSAIGRLFFKQNDSLKYSTISDSFLWKISFLFLWGGIKTFYNLFALSKIGFIRLYKTSWYMVESFFPHFLSKALFCQFKFRTIIRRAQDQMLNQILGVRD